MDKTTAENRSNTGDIKLAYDIYKNTISGLIANIEVYEHDLPREVMAQMAELFQIIASYESEIDESRRGYIWKAVEETQIKVTQYLYKHTTCLFIKKIEEYKKTFHKFNYQGVMCKEERFCDIAKASEKEIQKRFVTQLKKCYKTNLLKNIKKEKLRKVFAYIVGYIRICILSSFSKLKNEPYIPINDLKDEIDLKDVYKTTESLMKKYQEVYPNVINNGRKRSATMEIFWAICTWVIPAIASIPVVLKIINWLKSWI